MRYAAIIMAGGEGTRMKGLGEKPLIMVGGREMFKRVASALRSSGRIEEIVIAVSKHTPKTARVAASAGMRVIVTPGLGYVEDMRYAVNSVGARDTLVVNSDLPLITAAIINEVCDRYERAMKFALSVMTHAHKLRELGFEPAYDIHGQSPVGLNLLKNPLDGERDVEQEILVIEDSLHLVNINTPEDVLRAEELLKECEARISG